MTITRSTAEKRAPSPGSTEPAEGQPRSPFLLVSDVDNTLTGDDAALAQFSEWFKRSRDHFRLAYSSGRFPDSLKNSVNTSHLPEPDAYIGGVGTEIEIVSSGAKLGDWPPANGRWDPGEVREALMAYDELRLQPEPLLSENKISAYGEDLTFGFIDRLRREFADLKLDVNIVYSSGRDLDVLPTGVNKGTAVGHLAELWQIPTEHVIVAGDSGNDLEMFRQGYNGIIVGNAKPELKEFIAPHVYHAQAHHAAGVLEGLEYWFTKMPTA